MRQFNVIPRKSIGPVELGMTRQQIRGLLGEPSAVQVAYEKWGIEFPDKDFFYNNAFQVSYDSGLHADFIEAAADPAYRVTFDGIPVHDSEPSLLVDAISKHASIDREEREYPLNLWFPDIGLNLYREHSEFDKFETIGISKDHK
ncbi:MAG: hypothetical protein KDA66_06000 [Planctomycetaceae bacterium]|nr:hypothetical protein [Planctomycetaceae bacterium]